jgi:hypothetical protein
MSGGGGSSGKSKSEVRYAGYLEDKHKDFLNAARDARIAIIDDSPFAGYTPIEYADAFFGVGYVISSFPSLYDMFGKFMAGLDVDALYTQILDDSINSSVIDNRIGVHAIDLEDEIIESADPRFSVGMRDINSVISSSFIVGRAMMENARLKAISKYDAELRATMLPVAADRWRAHLEWNKMVVHTYAEILKLYFSSAMDLNEHNYSMDARDKLWPFTVLDFERACLGALQGATKSTQDVAGASTVQKAIGGAMTGAAAGMMVSGGNPVGGVIGGVIGLASAFL